MTVREAAAGLEAAPASRPEPIIRHAGAVVALAGLLGIIGQLLFHGAGLGINYPIAIGLLLLGGWLVGDRRRPAWTPDAWLAPAAVVYATFVAVRADPTILLLDVLASVALTGAALAALGGRHVSSRSGGGLLALGTRIAGWAASGAVPAARQARRRLPTGIITAARLRPAAPVLRGILIAAPLVAIFAGLFAAADAVFARTIEHLINVEIDLGELPGRIAVAAGIAWISAGALALAASVPSGDDEADAAAATGGRRWHLGATEAVTVIAAIDLLFIAFVALQAAYLFGGRDTLAEVGMTYSEYARRGFFELVTAAMLAGGLVIALDRLARPRARSLVLGSVALAALTFVVLSSATLRLRLYQEAYGWTELRLYVLATIALLAIGLVALVVALLADRVRWIGHVLVVAALTIGIGLNVLGPARFIAEQNVARVVDPGLVPDHGRTGMDEAYVLTLGDDAIPALIRALPHLPGGQASFVRAQLEGRLRELRQQPELNAWQAWNLGRESAQAALEAAARRDELD